MTRNAKIAGRLRETSLQKKKKIINVMVSSDLIIGGFEKNSPYRRINNCSAVKKICDINDDGEKLCGPVIFSHGVVS